MSDDNNEREEGNVSLKTLVDQLDEEDRMMEDANAVLGGSDVDRCTFTDGHVTRQALYSCLTCRNAKRKGLASEGGVEDGKKDGESVFGGGNKDGVLNGSDGGTKIGVDADIDKEGSDDGDKKGGEAGDDDDGEEGGDDDDVEEGGDDDWLAGVCLACSLHCHDGHNLVELYTKRNFQCDCGNSKFPADSQCKLCPDKSPLNEQNLYNQNFKGLYCVCHRPYPDPDLEAEEDMIQCILCEDWFHAKHLSKTLSVDASEFEELVCNKCMGRCDFLWAYVSLCKAFCEEGIFLRNDYEDGQKDENGRNERKDENGEIKGKERNYADEIKDKVRKNVDKVEKSENDGMVDVEKNGDSASGSELSVLQCTLKDLPSTTPPTSSPVYWPSKWRSLLCRCPSCKEMYNSKGVSYLIESHDSILAYEEAGKMRRPTDVETTLSKLNHVQKIELIQGYTDLKDNLTQYLKKFSENGKVVRQEDINEFFEMQSRKRRKANNGNQYYCK